MPELIKEPQELVTWLSEEDMLFRLNGKEAKILLGYLEGSGYSLEAENGSLFLHDDIDDTRDKITIDDVVDMVCEKNYELIEETTVKIAKAEIGEDSEREEAYLSSLLMDENVLDCVFERTRYQREMEQMLQRAAVVSSSLTVSVNR